MTSNSHKNSTQLIGRFFDGCAERGMFASFSPEDEVKLDRLQDRWDIHPGHHVLEPGCGSGRFTTRLATAVGPQGRVVACDLSPLMIKRARERDLQGWVEFHCSPVVSLIGPAHHYDRIICLNAFPHFEDPQAVLIAMAASLTPQGELWICHLTSREQVNAVHLKNPETENHLLPTNDAMNLLLKRASFVSITTEEDQDTYIIHARITC